MSDIDAILERLSGQTVGFHSTRAEKDAQALAAEVLHLRERLADTEARWFLERWERELHPQPNWDHLPSSDDRSVIISNGWCSAYQGKEVVATAADPIELALALGKEGGE